MNYLHNLGICLEEPHLAVGTRIGNPVVMLEQTVNADLSSQNGCFTGSKHPLERPGITTHPLAARGRHRALNR
jgi:hypothetical protein